MVPVRLAGRNDRLRAELQSSMESVLSHLVVYLIGLTELRPEGHDFDGFDVSTVRFMKWRSLNFLVSTDVPDSGRTLA